MTHFKNLLKEMKYSSSFDVLIDPNGEVVNFKSDFGNESLLDIQKMVNVLVREGGITLNGTVRNVIINIDDIGDEDYPYCIDVFHDVHNGVQEEDSVIPFTQELLDRFLLG